MKWKHASKLLFFCLMFLLIAGWMPVILESQNTANAADAFASTPEKSTYRIKVVLKSGLESYGSGTAVSPYHILTCSHILEGVEPGDTAVEIYAQKPEDGFQWKLLPVSVEKNWRDSDKDDIALLEYVNLGKDGVVFDFVPLGTEAEIPGLEREIVGVLGYANGSDKLSVMPTKLVPNDIVHPTYTASGKAEKGVSGGGVFTKEGKLAGVVWGTTEERVHATPLTGLINWTRSKQYVQTPYGGFAKNVYRDFSIFGPKKPMPSFYIGPVPMYQINPQYQQQPQAPQVKQGQPVPAPDKGAALTHKETLVRLTQMFGCGGGGCGSGGGGMMMGGGMQGGMMMAAPAPRRMQRQFAQRQVFDPNVSPYATRQTQAPQQQQQVAAKPPVQAKPQTKQIETTQALQQEPKLVKTSPCSCDREALEKKLDELACPCGEKLGKLDELGKKLDEIQVRLDTERLAAIPEKDNDIVNNVGPVNEEKNPCDGLDLSEIEDGIRAANEGIAGLSDRIAGLEKRPSESRLSTGKTPTPATDTPSKSGDCEEAGPELLYLTAANNEDCRYTDKLVRDLIAQGVKIRVVKLKAGQYTGVRDVPRLTVFKDGMRPDNYLGQGNISGFLADLR